MDGLCLATLVWFRQDALLWTRGEPKLYRSSPVAVRSHCDHCGALVHLAYDNSDEIVVTAGTLDHPEDLKPFHHYCIESRLGWADLGLSFPGNARGVVALPARMFGTHATAMPVEGTPFRPTCHADKARAVAIVTGEASLADDACDQALPIIH